MARHHSIRLFLFGALFVASLLSLLLFALPRGLGAPPVVDSGQGDGDGVRPPTPEEPAEMDLGAVLSVITAVISGLGFLFTTFFAFREDRRAAALHQLELAAAQKELAQKELEIEELRRRLGSQ